MLVILDHDAAHKLGWHILETRFGLLLYDYGSMKVLKIWKWSTPLVQMLDQGIMTDIRAGWEMKLRTWHVSNPGGGTTSLQQVVCLPYD